MKYIESLREGERINEIYLCKVKQSALTKAGKPYDTLEEVIGIRPSRGSLAEYGVTYKQVDLKEDGTFDYDAIRTAINEKTRLVEIQRSKGYQTRPSYSVKNQTGCHLYGGQLLR